MTSTTSNLTLSGYDTDDRFYATKYTQGGRLVYNIDLSPVQVDSYLPVPDPNSPTEGNRRLRENHAAEFANYIRTNEGWVSPSLLLRAPKAFLFEALQEVHGTQFGIVSIPRSAQNDLRILDGQHRILGIHLALTGISRDLEKQQDLHRRATRNSDPPAVLDQYSRAIEGLNDQRARLNRERISIQIVILDSSVEYKQIFFDIADNALGITSAVRARFDSRKVVNRTLELVMMHPLLTGRVDLEQDHLGKNNSNLVGAKHVADIVRATAVGLGKKIGKNLEATLREDVLSQTAHEFLSALMDGFTDLGRVENGELTPTDLRRESLLGSTTMLRVLAGVYYILKADDSGDTDIVPFFKLLSPHMAAPITDDSPWRTKVPNDIFTVGTSAPKARSQDVIGLANTIAGWARATPAWLVTPV